MGAAGGKGLQPLPDVCDALPQLPAGRRSAALADQTQDRHGDQLPAGVGQALVVHPGIEQVQLPYRTNHVDDSDILKALRAIQAAEAKGPVLMHCKHGSDRTGLVAAMYRVVVQGWSKEDALNEMTEGGFGDSHHFKDGVRYMMQADVDKLRVALANGDCSTSVFALCSLESWVNSTTTAIHVDPQVVLPER